MRVVLVSPEPTPYRAPLFDAIAARADIDLLVVYAARTVLSRTWSVSLQHPHVFLRGIGVPGARGPLRHDYPITPGIVRALARHRPDVVVVSGWSTFASQAAIAWCRVHRVPYVLLVESHDRGPRAGWRKAVKGAIVPRVVRSAAGVLATGTLVRESMIERGADPSRIWVFANTVDVAGYVERSDGLQGERGELRRGLGLEPDDVAVLCVARLSPEKGLDTLLRAVSAAGEPIVAVFAGDGPEAPRLTQLASSLGVRSLFLGDVTPDRVIEVYSACDVFVLLSRNETWGVVVNEAAACGLPLVLSEQVGAAHDLLRPDENGMLVPPDDVGVAADALRRLAADSELRTRFGRRSREIAGGWGYEASVQGFVSMLERVRPGS